VSPSPPTQVALHGSKLHQRHPIHPLTRSLPPSRQDASLPSLSVKSDQQASPFPVPGPFPLPLSLVSFVPSLPQKPQIVRSCLFAQSQFSLPQIPPYLITPSSCSHHQPSPVNLAAASILRGRCPPYHAYNSMIEYVLEACVSPRLLGRSCRLVPRFLALSRSTRTVSVPFRSCSSSAPAG
jgi:hypothetical protein